MAADIISGTEIAAQIREELKVEVAELKKNGITPGLVMVRVGEDPASVSYVSGKAKASDELGIYSETIVLLQDTKEEVLLTKVEGLNKDPKFSGILVQLPLPKHIDGDKVLNAIDPRKDVDGFHPVNVGKLLIGEP
ncbi:tetrahydrofolate dehydrogenase/cyclohydrolase catalytic domain-containing protein, partial [Chloroflexota bacterium]